MVPTQLLDDSELSNSFSKRHQMVKTKVAFRVINDSRAKLVVDYILGPENVWGFLGASPSLRGRICTKL